MNNQVRKNLNYFMMKWAIFAMIITLIILALMGQIVLVEQAFLSGLVLLIYKICQKKKEGKFNKKIGEKNEYQNDVSWLGGFSNFYLG